MPRTTTPDTTPTGLPARPAAFADQIGAVFDRSPLPQAVADRHGRMIAVNDALCGLLGFDSRQLLGRPLVDVAHGRDQRACAALLEDLVTGEHGSSVIEHDCVTSTGRLVPVRTTITCVPAPGEAPAGVAAGSHVVVEDLSDRRALEDRLERSVTLMRELADGISECLLELTLDGRVQWASPAAERCLGPGLTDSYAGLLTMTHPEDADRVRQALGVVLEKRLPESTVSMRLRLPGEARERHVDCRISVAEHLRPPMLLIRLADVTAARRTEALLEGETRIVSLLADAGSVQASAHALATLVEQIEHGLRCAVFAVDQQDGWRCLAAPSLPESLTMPSGRAPVWPVDTQPGLIAGLQGPMVIEDVRTDQRCHRCREPMLAAGIRSCWSVPLLDRNRQVYGALALYQSHAGGPAEHAWWLVQRLVPLAEAILSIGPTTHAAAPVRGTITAELAALTQRERDVLRLVAHGHTNYEIASQIGVSVRTVEAHRSSTARKLGTRTRAELVSAAIAAGLLP